MRPCYLVHNPPRPKTCRLCWLWLNDSRYQRLWADSPGELTKIKSFFGASIKHVFTGFQKALPEEYGKRLKICSTCSFRRSNICTKCGCKLNMKAGWKEQHCPINLW